MRSALLLLGLAACFLSGPRAGAHTENSQGFSTIRVEASRVSYELLLDYFEVARVVHLGASRDAPPTVLRGALHRHAEELRAYFDARLRVSLDGVGCPTRIAEMGVERRVDRDYARLDLEFSCPGTHAGLVLVRYDLLFDDSDSSHRNLVSYDAVGRQEQFVFTAAERELRLGEGSWPGRVLRFAELGVHHILGGYDHVLFVVALLLCTTGLWGVFQVLSLFTLAHSLTLAMALLRVAQFPSAVVEPLIALSIAYVAVESLLPGATRFRFAIVAAFGLVHGMGFAGALQLTGARGWGLAVPLVSFNLGIELGQGLLVLVVFPLLVLVRRFRWSPVVHGFAQATISVCGLFWYFERLMS